MTDKRTYENEYQKEAVERLLKEGVAVKARRNTEIEVYLTEHDGAFLDHYEIPPYRAVSVRGHDGGRLVASLTLRANWEDVDFDNDVTIEGGDG